MTAPVMPAVGDCIAVLHENEVIETAVVSCTFTTFNVLASYRTLPPRARIHTLATEGTAWARGFDEDTKTALLATNALWWAGRS